MDLRMSSERAVLKLCIFLRNALLLPQACSFNTIARNSHSITAVYFSGKPQQVYFCSLPLNFGTKFKEQKMLAFGIGWAHLLFSVTVSICVVL